MTQALLYHDIVPEGEYASSGFVSPDANIYKFSVAEFERHLFAIQSRHPAPAVSAAVALASPEALLLTFDDGGSSAIQWTADILERFGHVGHFFITTDYVGAAGFLSRADIAALARRGHIIGSHSCSHPVLMSKCASQQIEREWRESVDVLSNIVGTPVTIASVPGGSYSRAVGQAAARAGLRVLFTSEPVSSIGEVNGCALIGRYSIQRGTSSQTAAALAGGDWLAVFKQALYWNLKKVIKNMGGNAWIELRKKILSRRLR